MALEEQELSRPSSLLLDALYCEEEEFEDEVIDDDDDEEEDGFRENGRSNNGLFSSLLLMEQDLFWEDDELRSLFSKEQNQRTQRTHYSKESVVARNEAVEWILKVNTHYGFTTLTAVLAINYLDRFLCSSSSRFQSDKNKPWMIQLLAVTCLSLAAKVEETQVPLLLDLQVKGAKYVFEPKAIQRVELLVLSALEWKMHPVTPFSFLDHIIRRLGLRSPLHWEFLKRCERLLLTLVSDSRSVSYLPSTLATATMMHVIDQVEPSNHIEHQNQLLGVLKISKEEVRGCCRLIQEVTNARTNKRKFEAIPGSPGGVIDAAAFSCDDESSNDSWSSEAEPLFKKSRPVAVAVAVQAQNSSRPSY